MSVSLVPSLAALTLLLWLAWSDVAHRRLPNGALLLLLGLFLVQAFVERGLATMVTGLATGAAVLLLGQLLWQQGWLGGGDVKLLAILAVWAGPQQVVPLLCVTMVAGGIVGLALLALPRAGSGARPTVPYGVAIAFAGLAVIVRQSFGEA